MIFEEALSLMRKGAKIRHPYWEQNEYLAACYVGFKRFDEFGKEVEPTEDDFNEAKTKGMSIVKCKGKHTHPDMMPNFKRECDSELHAFPQLNLLLIMSDEWEVMEVDE